MDEELTRVFEMSPVFANEGTPVQIDGGALYKSADGKISAVISFSSRTEKQISAVIVDLIGSDVTGKQIEKQEHQYLDLSLDQSESHGADEYISLQDNRVRKLSANVKTVVYADGSMWTSKGQQWSDIQEKVTGAAEKTAGKMKKPLIWAVAVLAVALLVFGATKLFGGKKLDAKVGDTITFGHYPQTSSGTDNTAIEWLVLDVQGNQALVISKYGLDAKPYNTEYTSVTWETCTLRTWLNNDFYNKAFSKKEQGAILTTAVDNSASQCFDFTTVSKYAEKTTGGNNTQDKIFLLSYAEANKYFGVTYDNSNNTKSRVQPTAYAISQGAYTSSNYKTSDGAAAGWWWLRSPGYNQCYAAIVSPYGSLFIDYVYYVDIVVRPALWVNLESGIF